MEREANFPAPSSSSSSSATKNLLLDSIPIPSDNTHSSRLSTSSSSSSPPDILRHVQAAFKRHRPVGTMQSNNIRPRRILLPQRKTPTCDAADDSQNVVNNNNNVDSENEVQLPLGDNQNSQRVHVPMATSTDLISSHLNSLSLTEMEWDVSNRIDVLPPTNYHNDQKQQHIDMSDGGGGISSLLVKRSQFPALLSKDTSHPMTQSSVAASSCMTTTSVHSKSAPMLNFTTSSSCPALLDTSSNMDIEPVEALFNLNTRPESQGHPAHPTVKTTGVMLADSSVAHTQASVSSETPLGLKDNILSKEQNAFASKERNIFVQGFVDHAKGSIHMDDKSTKVKGYPADVTDVQSQAPMTKTSSENAKLEPSKSDKVEKAVSGKGVSGSRKKNYDPELFFKVNGKLYQKLGKIGSGGSSEVYKVISSDCTIYALKKIKLKGRDYSTAYGFCQEIEYLNKLKGKNNIIQLINYEVTDKVLLREVMNGSFSIKDGRIRDDEYIYVVLEYGEIDLAHMLSHKWKEMDSSDWRIDENWLRFYWQQILQAVNTIHEERIVHSDLKPANFLLVRGSLKLIDFGIAKAIMSDTTNIQRDSQVGTLSYMSPEAFMCNENDADGNTIKCGRPSDIWSLGCILYQMVYGRTPFSEYKTFWAKFKVITDRNHEITYGPVTNPWLLDLMKKCLAWERNDRWRIPQLLQHPFLVPPLTPPSQLSLIQDQSYKVFQNIAEAYVDDSEVSRLCSQLQELIKGPATQIKSHFNPTRDQHCGWLSHVSRLCCQLYQHLTNCEK